MGEFGRRLTYNNNSRKSAKCLLFQVYNLHVVLNNIFIFKIVSSWYIEMCGRQMQHRQREVHPRVSHREIHVAIILDYRASKIASGWVHYFVYFVCTQMTHYYLYEAV